jgi:hypothetical protein
MAENGKSGEAKSKALDKNRNERQKFVLLNHLSQQAQNESAGVREDSQRVRAEFRKLLQAGRRLRTAKSAADPQERTRSRTA